MDNINISNDIVSRSMNHKTCSVVFGGHVNGYCIVKDLYDNNCDIAVVDSGLSMARFSNKINLYMKVERSRESILRAIESLNKKYDYLVLFPTDDFYLETLLSISNEITKYCYLPFHTNSLLNSLDKRNQYKICDEKGLPYPKTVSLANRFEVDQVRQLNFPVVIKPSVRKDLTVSVFRSLLINDFNELSKVSSMLEDYICRGIEFLVSEVIPGDDTNIYAYTCFRSQDGQILNEWVGKKLNQYPDNYGVFSSAVNDAPDIISRYGRTLVESLDAYGVVEPEFKFDYRDSRFKLMEVNLRSMMWHGLGSATGVNLQLTQLCYATKRPIVKYSQVRNISVHLVLMLHEIPNLISRPGYWTKFKHNVWGSSRRKWAIYDRKDLMPFAFSLVLLIKLSFRACLKRLRLS